MPNKTLPDYGPTCVTGLTTIDNGGDKIIDLQVRIHINHTIISELSVSLKGTTAPNITLWN